MCSAPGGTRNPLQSLDETFSAADVSMDLTMCGLLVDRAEELARLYATHSDWAAVEETWFSKGHSGRSTRGSARKIFRILTDRYKNASVALPPPTVLPKVFEICDTHRDKAQILYLYLLEDDPLVRYTIHEYARRFTNGDEDALMFDSDTIIGILEGVQYKGGKTLDYAESTLTRWAEGFRSVMREIGVLDGQQSFKGSVPTLNRTPLLTTASYSWQRQGEDWVTAPAGWLHLFQPEPLYERHADRVAREPGWTLSEVRGQLKLMPEKEEPYAWVDARSNR